MARIDGLMAAIASAAVRASSRGDTCFVATRWARPSASWAAYSESFIGRQSSVFGRQSPRAFNDILDELHDLVFGPVAVITRAGRGDKSTVAAMAAHPQIDMRVAGDLRVAKRLRRDERIVLGRNDERRDADAIDHAHGAGAMVIVFFVAEAEVRRRIGAIERAHGLDPVQVREVERAGVEPGLAPHPALQVADEVPFVEDVAGALQRA